MRTASGPWCPAFASLSRLRLSLGNLRNRLGPDGAGVVGVLVRDLNAIPGIKVELGASGPSVPLLPLAGDEAFAAFTTAYGRLIDGVRVAELRE